MITIKENKSEYKDETVEELTRIVFKECGLEGELVIDDWNIDRIFITKEEREWIIRTWDIRENNKGRAVIYWTLYTPNGSCLGSGKTVIKIK